MNFRTTGVMLSWIVLLPVFCTNSAADGPWTSLIPFRRVEADPKKSYALAEEHGPWLVLAANFAGERAEQQAHELVIELRSRYKLTAYVHKMTYDFTQTMPGRLTQDAAKEFRVDDPSTLLDKDSWKPLRYANAARYEGVAVLVGNFRSVEDADIEKTLERIKQLQPECLQAKGSTASGPWATLREVKRRISTGQAKSRGPLGTAFVTRNPLLPAELFAPGGVDDFVARLNKGVQYSLLDNKGRYTVRVATFRGNTTINQREIREMENYRLTNKLEIAADKSHRLTMALRERGVEAYEFHDRTESIVTIGSFDYEGKPLQNGTIEIAPEILKTINDYKAVQRALPGQAAVGLQPRILAGITFDVQPVPIPVPRRSVAADYARTRRE